MGEIYRIGSTTTSWYQEKRSVHFWGKEKDQTKWELCHNVPKK